MRTDDGPRASLPPMTPADLVTAWARAYGLHPGQSTEGLTRAVEAWAAAPRGKVEHAAAAMLAPVVGYVTDAAIDGFVRDVLAKVGPVA